MLDRLGARGPRVRARRGALDERPTAGVFHAKGDSAAFAPAARSKLTTVGGNEQGAQAYETV